MNDTREVWDEEKCERFSRSKPKDYWGNRPPYPGLMSMYSWDSLPKIPDTFEYHWVPTWGTQLRRRHGI